MKNLQSNYHEVEKKVNESLLNIKQELIINAEQMGAINRPLFTEFSYQGSFSQTHFKCQNLIEEVNRDIPVGSILRKVDNAKTTLNGEVQNLEGRKAEILKTKIDLDCQKDCRPSVNKVTVKLLHIAVALLSILEGMLSQLVFEGMGTPLWLSWVLALFFCVVIELISYTLPTLFIKYTKSKIQKVIFILTAEVFLFFLFYFMASFRAETYTLDTLNPMPFALTSLLFVTVACIAVYLYHPSKEEMEELRKHEERIKKKKNVENALKSIEQDKKNLLEGNDNKIINSYDEFSFGLSLENRIINTAHALYYSFPEINKLKRTDGVVPPCFINNQQYPFHFKTYFLKQQQLSEANQNIYNYENNN